MLTCLYSKKKICAIYGKWTECLYTVDPATFDLHKKADKKSTEEKKGSKQVCGWVACGDLQVTSLSLGIIELEMPPQCHP